MHVPSVEDFEKLTDNEAQVYISKVVDAYNQARMSRFIKAYCNQNRLSRHTYQNLMDMSNVQPKHVNKCQATVVHTGAMCTRCALPEYGGVFCGYHRKQYEKHKREQAENRKNQVVKKNKRGKKLEI